MSVGLPEEWLFWYYENKIESFVGCDVLFTRQMEFGSGLETLIPREVYPLLQKLAPPIHDTQVTMRKHWSLGGLVELSSAIFGRRKYID